MTRLGFLRMLGMVPMARYGSLGQAHRRPDQQTDAPPSAVAPTQAAGILRARLVIVFGTNAGVFVYNGTPRLGNPPIASLTNQTTDPFGNVTESGDTAYVIVSGSRWAVNLGSLIVGLSTSLAGLSLQNLTNPLNVPPAVLGNGSTAAGSVLELISGKATAGGQQSGIDLEDSLFGGIAGGLIQYTSGRHQIFIGDGLSTVEALRVAYTTSAANPFMFLTAIASVTPGQLTTASVIWVDASGFPRLFPAGSNFDTNTYGVARRIFRASGQLVNSLVAASVTGITGISVAAATYLIRGMIIVDQGAGGAGNQGIQITGPAISSMNIAWNCIEAATIFSSGVQTALNTSLTTGAVPISQTATLHFDGEITFSASGSTFGLAALCITAVTDTWTLRAGSYLELLPV